MLQIYIDKHKKALLCIAPGQLAIHVQHVCNGAKLGQLLLLLELLRQFSEPQHYLVNVVGYYTLARIFSPSLPANSPSTVTAFISSVPAPQRLPYQPLSMGCAVPAVAPL